MMIHPASRSHADIERQIQEKKTTACLAGVYQRLSQLVVGCLLKRSFGISHPRYAGHSGGSTRGPSCSATAS